MSVRIVFFGNHTVGVAVLEELVKKSQLVGIVAHPEDPEDGVRYESVFAWGISHGVPTVRGKASDHDVSDFVRNAAPELLWITDYRYLLPSSILKMAPHGAINLHPSLLPEYRGRAPINWAILNGETRLGLTAHLVDEGVDSGPIIQQVSYELRPDEDVGDALNKLMPLYCEMTAKLIEPGATPWQSRPQPIGATPPFPARTPEDGAIDWSKPARDVVNLVRAVARPYPGAFTQLGSTRLIVWRAVARDSIYAPTLPGTILQTGPDGVLVRCGEGAVQLSDYVWHGEVEQPLAPGQRLGVTVEEQAATVAQYESLLAEHGDSYRALNWGSEAGQQRRFEVLAGIGDLSGRRVLDVGCGLAHFADWLQRQGVLGHYTGLDIVPSLISAAAERRPDLELVCGSILDHRLLDGKCFDYVMASGIFATYCFGAESMLHASVCRMWQLARKGVAFNALSYRAQDKHPGEYYADPASVLDFCRTVAVDVCLIDGYHPRDFTIYMRR